MIERENAAHMRCNIKRNSGSEERDPKNEKEIWTLMC